MSKITKTAVVSVCRTAERGQIHADKSKLVGQKVAIVSANRGYAHAHYRRTQPR